ncbi:MAG: peptidoglycan hydrolase-like protein with peptidoglycan-binding domain [Candidatus Azotimanducaceae bacterium]|jgi:peptidoglycan hydrolase-like protein with peptidoglycan-binding domain
MENTVVLSLRFTLTLLVLSLMPFVTQAETSSEVFDQISLAQNAGYQNIDNITLKTKTLEITTFEYTEKTSSLKLDNGTTVYVMRNVPPNEIQERYASQENELSNLSAEDLRRAAREIEEAGRQMEAGMSSEMKGAGLPGGIGGMLMDAPADQPWLSPNPNDMTSMYATMLNAAATGKDMQAAENPVGDAQRQAEIMAAIQKQTKIVGRGQFNGIDVIELLSDDLSYTSTEDSTTTTWNSVRMKVDAKRYVPLLLVMEGVITDGKERRPITVEREDMDYRNVAGCGELYRPFKSVMRLGGVLTPEQQAELAEASEKLGDLEAQMANMPANQRKMMERMMGPQLEMIRKMASGGGIEIESTIVELRCNAGLPDPIEVASTTFGSTFAGRIMSAASESGTSIKTDADLLKMVQVDLKRIGYKPGNTKGSLDKLTAVAISKFQASKGMDVSGRASPQLAGMLQAEEADTSNNRLSPNYLKGFWCTERKQERALYNFASDGSYRLGVVGLTITQAGGVNYFPETHNHQSFLDKFKSVPNKDVTRFSVVLKNGSRETFIRGNCIE